MAAQERAQRAHPSAANDSESLRLLYGPASRGGMTQAERVSRALFKRDETIRALREELRVMSAVADNLADDVVRLKSEDVTHGMFLWMTRNGTCTPSFAPRW